MEQLKKYCLMSRTKFYIISILLCAASEFAGIVILMTEDEDGAAFEDPILAGIVSGIVILIFWLIFHHSMIVVPRNRFKKRLKYFESHGLLNYALSDIQNGVKKFNGNVLLGQYCIMGKGSGLIVFYNEISSMYVKIDRSTDDDGGTTESWTLKIDAGGKTYDICNVKKSNQSIKDWQDISTFLRLKAPNIIVK